MEMRKRHRCVEKEAISVSYSTLSSSTSDDDGSAFETAEEGVENLSYSSSLSLEAEESGSSGEAKMPELRSKQVHDLSLIHI